MILEPDNEKPEKYKNSISALHTNELVKSTNISDK